MPKDIPKILSHEWAFFTEIKTTEIKLITEIKTRNSHMLHRNIKPENFTLFHN